MIRLGGKSEAEESIHAKASHTDRPESRKSRNKALTTQMVMRALFFCFAVNKKSFTWLSSLLLPAVRW